jgi:hypothetical protein
MFILLLGSFIISLSLYLVMDYLDTDKKDLGFKSVYMKRGKRRFN